MVTQKEPQAKEEEQAKRVILDGHKAHVEKAEALSNLAETSCSRCNEFAKIEQRNTVVHNL